MHSTSPVLGRDRKPSLSFTPAFIAQGLSVHTASTPDEVSSSHGNQFNSYFSLSRSSSHGKQPLIRRTSLKSPASATSASPDTATNTVANNPFSLKLTQPKMFTRTPTASSLPPAGPTAGGVPMTMGAIPVPTSPHVVFTTVHETCTKRIATLDYLRRAHEGRVYFFNVLLTPRAELSKTVYPDAKKLQKKAAHFFTLGNSLPSVLDLSVSSPVDYLKALNALLQEYESFIALPPGRNPTLRSHSASISTTASSVSASSARSFSKLWSRTTHPKPRRGSSATTFSDATLERTRSSSAPTPDHPDHYLHPAHPQQPPPPPLPNGGAAAAAAAAAATAAGTGDEYIHLTPLFLPFEPDYFETFATLCDTLIDCYSRVLQLVATPQQCVIGVGEAFAKTDARIRRLVVAGTVREWEEAVRGGVKRDVAGVAREVLGGML
jgi:hypothetical protein